MPSWSDLQSTINGLDPKPRAEYVDNQLKALAKEIGTHYDRNVVYYASSFLQKPMVPSTFTSLNMEDINGFMAGIHGHDFDKGLLLILHTPGGMPEAAQTIVDYLRSKFDQIDVLIPTYAMSAGTMIALGCDNVIMGRQSQLGPTDPQLAVGNYGSSAHSIVDQFNDAKSDISKNPILAHAWAPVLEAFGPALLQEAKKSISYAETLVKDWLSKYMLSDKENGEQIAQSAAKYFAGNHHGSHGRRINRNDLRSLGIKVTDLEDDQELQELVLTLYHLSTIIFDNSPSSKFVVSSNERLWVKNMQVNIPMDGVE